MTDSELAESFTRWASERQQALLRTAVLICGDHHRAEDLVQDALTQPRHRRPPVPADRSAGFAL